MFAPTAVSCAGDNIPSAQDPGGPPRLAVLHTLRAALTAHIASPSHIAGMTPCTTPAHKDPHNPRHQLLNPRPFLFPFRAGRQVARSPPPMPLSRITCVIRNKKGLPPLHYSSFALRAQSGSGSKEAPGGAIFLTQQGDSIRAQLTAKEDVSGIEPIVYPSRRPPRHRC